MLVDSIVMDVHFTHFKSLEKTGYLNFIYENRCEGVLMAKSKNHIFIEFY